MTIHSCFVIDVKHSLQLNNIFCLLRCLFGCMLIGGLFLNVGSSIIVYVIIYIYVLFHKYKFLMSNIIPLLLIQYSHFQYHFYQVHPTRQIQSNPLYLYGFEYDHHLRHHLHPLSFCVQVNVKH